MISLASVYDQMKGHMKFEHVQAVVKVRRSALEHCSATSNFSRVALQHMYFCRETEEEQGRNYATDND